MKKRKQFIAQVLSIALSCSIVNSYTPLPSVMASTTEENIQNTEDAEKVYGYGTMTMTYQEFYAGDVNNAGDIDAVSSATTTKNTLFSNADTTEPTESGYQIKGVKNVPVRVMESASEELKTRVSFNEKETELPTQYKLIDRNGIGAFIYNIKDTVSDASFELNTNSRWGDYEISIIEKSTTYLRNTRSEIKDEETKEEFEIGSKLQGVILETAKGYTVAALHLQNIWIQPYKLAFSLEGNVNSNEFKKLEGETIRKVTYIIEDAAYVYDFGEQGIYIKPVYQGEISGKFNSEGSTFLFDQEITNLENATIAISYQEGRKKVELLKPTAISGKEYTLETLVPKETFATVIISSDNYADIIVNYPMMSWQKEKLEDNIEEAASILSKLELEDTILKAHKMEAEALLTKETATAIEANELMNELTNLLNSAADKLEKEIQVKLFKAIEDAEKLVKTDYTQTSWEVFEKALTVAKSQVAESSTWKEKEDVLTNLAQSMKELIKATIDNNNNNNNSNNNTNNNNNNSSNNNGSNSNTTNNGSSSNITNNGSNSSSNNATSGNNTTNTEKDSETEDKKDNNTSINTNPNQNQQNMNNQNNQQNNADTNTKIDTTDTVTLKKGDSKTINKVVYKVTNASKNGKGTVEVVAPKNNKVTKVVIPATVKINGVILKVTSIKKNAFKDNTKLISVKIGKNITNIGKNAFANAVNCKKITIVSTKLKKVEKNAFKNISKSAKIIVPSSKIKKYQKLLKGKGQSADVKIQENK